MKCRWSPAGQPASSTNLDPADSSATAIVIEAAETTAVECSKVLALYEEKSKEYIAYKLEVEGKVTLCDKVTSDWADKERAWIDKESSLTEAVEKAQQEIKDNESNMIYKTKLLEEAREKCDANATKYSALHAKYLDLQDLLRTSQQSQETSQSLLDACQAELEIATKANIDNERRVKEMMMATSSTLKKMAQ